MLKGSGGSGVRLTTVLCQSLLFSIAFNEWLISARIVYTHPLISITIHVTTMDRYMGELQ